jgi:hypothetical protein
MISKEFLQIYITKIVRAELYYRKQQERKLEEEQEQEQLATAAVEDNQSKIESLSNEKAQEGSMQPSRTVETESSNSVAKVEDQGVDDDIIADAEVDLEGIIKACESSNQYDELIDFIIDTNVKLPPDTFTRVMSLLGKVGYVHEVVRLMIIMRNRGVALTINHYKTLMEILYQNGQWEGCYRYCLTT